MKMPFAVFDLLPFWFDHWRTPVNAKPLVSILEARHDPPPPNTQHPIQCPSEECEYSCCCWHVLLWNGVESEMSAPWLRVPAVSPAFCLQPLWDLSATITESLLSGTKMTTVDMALWVGPIQTQERERRGRGRVQRWEQTQRQTKKKMRGEKSFNTFPLLLQLCSGLK